VTQPRGIPVLEHARLDRGLAARARWLLQDHERVRRDADVLLLASDSKRSLPFDFSSKNMQLQIIRKYL
jgi:hypothetical protein